MKTLVYQSFRTFDVPLWMEQCMESVRAWAELLGFDYRFVDDSFFSYVPQEFNQAVKGQRHLVSDLARLELARLYLGEWDRVIWVDADVFVLDIHRFSIDDAATYLFCSELWMTHWEGKIVFSERVNNSICVFCKDNEFLDFYRSACKKIVYNKSTKLAHTDIGTGFLTRIKDVLPLIKTAVVFSPFLLMAIRNNNTDIINLYRQHLGAPIQAVNLCLTFRNTTYKNQVFDDSFYLDVINRLRHFKNTD